MQTTFEEMFHRHGVDLVIQAHMHSYERMWPVYRGRPTAFNYNNPKSPVHIVSGAAGCNEQLGWCINMVDHPHGMLLYLFLTSPHQRPSHSHNVPSSSPHTSRRITYSHDCCRTLECLQDVVPRDLQFFENDGTQPHSP